MYRVSKSQADTSDLGCHATGLHGQQGSIQAAKCSRRALMCVGYLVADMSRIAGVTTATPHAQEALTGSTADMAAVAAAEALVQLPMIAA